MTVNLGALDSSHNDLLRHWRNDPRIYSWCRQSDFISDADQERWFKRQSEDPSILMYAVWAAGVIVGAAGLTSIDWINRRAEFSLYIGPEFQQRGYGKAALAALFDHGFYALNLKQIWGECFAKNPAMSLFAELGMMEDGVRRAFYFKDGKYIDCHLISIMREEWHGQEETRTT